jgi:hypothetical protein
MIPRALVALGAGALLATGCAGRRDTAEVAAGQPPFTELRGIPFTALRVGEVRAFRRNAAPAPGIGLEETIGDFRVRYVIPDFDGADGSWPAEDVMVAELAAMRVWSDDSTARVAWNASADAIREATGIDPTCSRPSAAADGGVELVEFDRGDSLFLALRLVRASAATDSVSAPPSTQLAIRRSSSCPQP